MIKISDNKNVISYKFEDKRSKEKFYYFFDLENWCFTISGDIASSCTYDINFNKSGDIKDFIDLMIVAKRDILTYKLSCRMNKFSLKKSNENLMLYLDKHTEYAGNYKFYEIEKMLKELDCYNEFQWMKEVMDFLDLMEYEQLDELYEYDTPPLLEKAIDIFYNYIKPELIKLKGKKGSVDL